jgi:hypothetical protein
VGCEGRSLFGVEILAIGFWVMRGDRWLMWEVGDRGCDGEERSLFDFREIGDRVCG